MNDEKEITGRNYNDRLDIFKDIATVKSRIKKDITSDFVFASLKEEDKQFIIEMTENAYYVKTIIEKIKKKAYKYEYKGEDKEGQPIYEKVYYEKDDEESKRLDQIGNRIFDSYMNKIYMIVTLNRNVDKNHLIKLLSGYKEEQEQDPTEQLTQLQQGMKVLTEDKTTKEK